MACEDGKIVRWCRAQASSRHNTQGVVDDGFNKADVSTAAPDRTAVLVVECTKADVAVRKIVTPAPQMEPASRLKSVARDVSFLLSGSRCRRLTYVSDLPNVTRGIWARGTRTGSHSRYCSCLLAHVRLPCC